jgi:hypothetical protein
LRGGGGSLLLLHCELLLGTLLCRGTQLHSLFGLPRAALCVTEALLLALSKVAGFGCARTLDGPKTTEDVVSPPDIRYSQSHGSLLYAIPPNRFGAARVTP